MAHSKASSRQPRPQAHPNLPQLPSTTLAEQNQRRYIAEDWQPLGFDRFPYQKALLDGMPVLGGLHDQGMGNPDRYTPVSDQFDVDFPVRSRP